MQQLPEYKLVGNPIKLKRHGKLTSEYWQSYRLLPNRRIIRAPCCSDKQTSQRKAIYYTEQHIRKNLRDPAAIYAATTILEHLKTYEESLKADKDNKKYIQATISRIKQTTKAMKWRMISDIDGLRLKNWVAKMKCSLKTARDFLACYKAFTHFLYLNNRIETNPLDRTTLVIKGDALKATTRKRRCITQEEFIRLLAATANGSDLPGHMTGEQRRMLYLLTASTGFRAQECASITPRNFTLDTDRPTVMIDCHISKRRRYDTQELSTEIADEFRRWLVRKPMDEKLWPGKWWDHAARMLRVDLKAAGIPFSTREGVIDFHAVGRVHFITRLVGTASPLTLVQRIARLSTPALLERYYQPADNARMEAIAKMPSLLVG